MDSDERPERTFAPITVSQSSRSSSRLRSRSRSRSQRSVLSLPQSLSHVYSAQSFDDHTVYTAESPTVSHGGDEDEDDKDADDEDDVRSEEELEREKSVERNEPIDEVGRVIRDDRDIEAAQPRLELETTKSKRERDPNLVTWDGPDDPGNPKNWSLRRKWAATFVVSSFTFISPVSSSMVAPALQAMNRDLHITSDVESALVLSIFVLAYAVGPLFLDNEVYGRVHILQLSNMFYLVWNIGCSFAKTKEQMLAFRFLSGLGGSAPLAIGGGLLSDCWSADQRGKAISIYSLAPLLGPAVGPIAGGWIAERTTWRWVFWSTSILDFIIQCFGLFFLQETYAPILLQRRAARLRKETGNDKLHTEFDHPDRTLTNVLGRALVRPFRLLFTQPIIITIAIYMAYLYGLMYLLLSTFPALWTGRYHEGVGIGGLNYISLGLGFFLGTQIVAPINDRIYRRLKRRNNNVGRPEFRVPLMFIGSVLVPIGLFWYGWSAEAKLHFVMPNVGAAIFGAGTIISFQCMQTYIVDSYQRYAASGVAAAVVLRSLAGFGFPLFAKQMYGALGYGWGNSLLGFIAVGVGIPAPFLFWRFGEKLRGMSKYAAG